MTPLPTGTVTFLFTDIEGSTQRWERDRAAMQTALARHNAILDRAIAAHGGHVFHTAGDAYCAAFAHAADALAAAIDAQRALHLERWDEVGRGFERLRVRMGIHTGLVELKDGDYFGRPVNRVARLMASAHGGQVLVSLATQQLVRDALPEGAKLVDLGVHRLKDLEHTEHLFRLVAPGFPDVATTPDTAEALPAGSRAPADVDALPADCPYRGLHAFREADAPFFFGRESFTELLAAAVAAAPMVGVIGPSGSGKSSVVFAGLVPRLRAQNGRGRWMVVELRPGSRPYHALAATLLPLYEGAALSATERLAEVNRLAGYLRDGTVSPADVLAQIADQNADQDRLLLVVDQFEELYTLCADDREQRAFQDLLFAAVFGGSGGNAGLPLTLALTLRADFMGHALAYRPFADAIQKHDVKLGPMTREELTRVVRLPAEKQGRAFETGLVERIVDDVGEKAGSLPLLEFALTKLWDLQEGGWLTHDAYERISRVEGAVARHADAVYGGLGSDEQQRSRRVFVQLVQPGEGTEDTRRLATREELGEDWPLARKLADARLVTTGRDGAGHETAEVVHEALIRSWGQLREWMNADRTFRSWQERLRFALRQWEATGHDEGALLRGAPLAEAEGWLKERGGELGAAEREFVEHGVEVRDREFKERQAQLEREAAAARTLRRRAVWLAGALVAAGGLAIAALAFGQQARTNADRADQERSRASAREIAAAAMANRNRDPELSVLLALQAISVGQSAGGIPIPEPEQALHLALQHTRRRLTLVAHAGGVLDADVSPDGLRLATCGNDGIKVWDLATGQTVLTMTQSITTVSTVAFSPDGTLLASGGPDRQVAVWSATTGERILRLPGHADNVTQVAFSPDGSRLASASRDKTAVVWEARTGKAVLTLKGHTAGVRSVAWSPDRNRLATGSTDLTAKLWNASTGDLLLTLSPSPAVSTIQGVAFSPDGARLATVGGGARIWDTTSGSLLQEVKGHGDGVTEGVFSSDGKRLLTASLDKTAGVWDLREYEAGIAQLVLAGHSASVGDVEFTPDGRQAITASGDGTVGVWDITRGQAWRTLRPQGRSSIGVVFSPDARSIASANRDGLARIWDLNSPSETAAITFTGHISDVVDVAYSPDGHTVATASWDKTAKLWEASSGKLMRTFTGHSDWVTGVAFSPDGTRLATASKDKSAKLWDTRTGEMLLTLSGHTAWVNKVSFSPDGTRLATGSDDKFAKVWDAATGQELLTLTGHTLNVGRLRYSPDGNWIATSSDDRTARVWDASNGRELVSIASHQQPIQGIDFSPDGSRLATSSWDGAVKIWDPKTGEELLAVTESSGSLLDVAYSPDGSHIAVGGGLPYDNVYIYTLRLDELIGLAHERVNRTLTEKECRAFLHLDACPPAPLTRPVGK